MTHEAWMSISADGAPPGVYTKNMSAEDGKKWKAKCIDGDDPRVEIRVTRSSDILIVVRICSDKKERGKPNVLISSNGKMEFSFEDIENLGTAVDEAYSLLIMTTKERKEKLTELKK